MVRSRMSVLLAAAAIAGLLALVPTVPATAAASASPSPRCCMDMAYDAASNQVVLFGGFILDSPYLLGDTCTWDGTDWTQRFPAHFPSARYYTSMAYDAARGQVVMFGGQGRNLLG